MSEQKHSREVGGSPMPICGCNSVDVPGLGGGILTDRRACLYPEAVKLNESLQRRLTQAEALVDRLIMSAGWQGTKAIQEAEEFLRPTKGNTANDGVE